MVPKDFELAQPVELDAVSRGIAHVITEEVTCQLFAAAMGSRPCTLVVENDLAQPTDPNLVPNAVFMDDYYVLEWTQLSSDCRAAVEAIYDGSSGYPLHAYLIASSASSDEVFVSRRFSVDVDAPLIARTLLAILVSVFDNETYVVLY